MTRPEFSQLVSSGSDEDLVDSIFHLLPEYEEDDGHFEGDVIRVAQYANAEICNGGFYQFYCNRIFNPMRVIECFEALGVMAMADCVRESMRMFPDGQPPVRLPGEEPIDDKLEALGIDPGSFEEIEGIYYSHTKEFYESWAPYIRRNPDVYLSYLPAE